MEIKKLADIIEWANSWIEGIKPVLIKLGEFETDKDVKQLEAVKRVVSEAIERHEVYTSALNNDIADKAAKIDLLEKEIEGRKEGYLALKEKMDTQYISIDDHNDVCEDFKKKIVKLKKESEKWQDLAKMNRDTICNQYDVCEDFKKKIAELEEENEKLKVDLVHEREKNEKLAKDHAELENDMRKYATDIISQSGTICNLKKELDRVKASKENWFDTANAYARTVSELNNEKEKLDETIKNCIPLTAYEIAVNDLKEEIKKLEEENKDLKIRDEELTKQVANKLSDIDSLRSYITELKRTIKYYKNQERIRTDQLRATESKVEELWEEIEKLKNEKANMEDEYGRKGFKRYIKWLVKEEEEKFKESWKARLNEELATIFKEEEETEVKGVHRMSSGRYPWGAKVNDIPCGEDAIE